MPLVRPLLTCILSLLVSVCAAQPPNEDCNSASTLCAQQPLTGDNTGASGSLPTFCPPGNNLLWYTFTTNSTGGFVTIDISDIDCPVVAGMDNELNVVVLSGDGTCDPGTFQSVSDCTTDSLDFSVLTTDSLAPNTQYWVIVSGAQNGGTSSAAQCGFTITASGPGVDVVGVDFFAGPDVEIGEGETTHLLATGGTTYDWSPTDGLSGNNIPDPFATPGSTTTYTVSTVINGCTYTDDVLVEVIRRIDPPSGFTPNGDGINDTWEIPGIEDYPNAEVNVFDRWGQRVLHSSGYKEAWDGEDLPAATYYYVIDLKQLEGQSPPYTGYVAIIK